MLAILRAIGQAIILGVLGILSFLGIELDYNFADTNKGFDADLNHKNTVENILKISQEGVQDFQSQKNKFFSLDNIFGFFSNKTSNLLDIIEQNPIKTTFLHEINFWEAFEQTVPIENIILTPQLEIELDKIFKDEIKESYPVTTPTADPKPVQQPAPVQVVPVVVPSGPIVAPKEPEPVIAQPEDTKDYEPDLQGEIGTFSEVAVNIICKQQQGSMISATTGSGVMVSPKGVILTNAHVAQHVLLEDSGHDTSCVVYRNNISDYSYSVDVLYFPPSWMESNFNSIKEVNPRGTGEYDFALLLITKSTKRSNNNQSFPYAKISLDNNKYKEGSPINITGYPGGVSKLFNMDRSDILNTDKSIIEKVYSFNRQNNIDLFSTSQTHVAQRGASGGGIFSANDLIGITVTISEKGSGNSINSITTKYINTTMQEEYGKDLMRVLSDDPSIHLNYFQKNLLNKLANYINK